MVFHGLVACGYAPLVERIVPCLDVAGIAASVCTQVSDAERRVLTSKYDAIVVDCENLAQGRETLQQVRQSPSNRNCVTFAISETTDPNNAWANFLLSPHFSEEHLLQALQYARSLMVAEQLRYYRHPVNLMARLTGGSRLQDEPIPISNLSQGGMLIKPPVLLSLGSRVELRFQLPGAKPISAEAEVVWTMDDGRAGVGFTRITREAKESLVAWLSEQWVVASTPLPPIPDTLGGWQRRNFGTRLLRCHAFLKQIPVGWKCSHCRWQMLIPVEESSWRYENNPPSSILEAFEQHACRDHAAEGGTRH